MRKSKGKNGKLLPSSFRIISSCIKTVSTNANTAVRSAGASLAASISAGDDRKEQVLWAGFDKLENSPTSFRHVLLLGYLKGFQVFDVEDASDLSELVSKRDGPVTFLQMLPIPANSEGPGRYQSSHPLLVVVGGSEDERISYLHNTGLNGLNGSSESLFSPPTAVRFYSMKLNEYIKVIDFKSPVFMVRCSPRVVVVGLEEQAYCFDTQNLEKKFMVVTYPVPRVSEHSASGISIGYGPMAVGPRWLAYPPNRPFMVNMGRVSPKSLSSSVSPSTSPGGSSMMARYAMESSKQLASGLLTLGDMGYKKLSKYYPELLPESPSSPGWKAGKLAASEPENAGVVAVKDLVCSEVIAQFRAHSSPISALCFDPSGTLLITASVHGNNINIFRIMPCHKCSGPSAKDWSSTYVHLYKLHRGVTSAVIQDICFGHYSQWIAIVSSRGTCHIYALSPFGGDNGLQTLYAQRQDTSSLSLTSSLPWWSSSSFSLNEPSSSPPPPTCNLSVLARIKCCDSGLLNSVSNAAASVIGKLWVPTGAVAAVFHNSNLGGANVISSGNALEHVLVYTPSGFVVQHEISFSMGFEPDENGKQSLLTQQVNPQNEELRVKVDPIRWWDVCRRLDNMEREESISASVFHAHNNSEIDEGGSSVFNASARGKESGKIDSLKSQDRSDLHLSNAEVQINNGRFPLWEKPKMCFHVIESPKAEHHLAGEFEVEMASSHELVIKRKDLLPIFEHFPSTRSGWADRSVVPHEVKHPTLSSNGFPAREKTGSFICHSKTTSFNSSGISQQGSTRRVENVLDLGNMNIDRPQSHCISYLNTGKHENKHHTTAHLSGNIHDDNFIVNDDNANASSSSSSDNGNLPVTDEITDSTRADIVTSSEAENIMNPTDSFKEGYGNKRNINHSSIEDERDINDSNHDEGKTEEGEGWIGGMFDLEEC